MGMILKAEWKKLPSVTREGKWFYRAIIDGIEVTVLQSMYSGMWLADWKGGNSGECKTAKQAMKVAENRI